MSTIRESINAAVEQIEDSALPTDEARPLTHGEDIRSPAEHARQERARAEAEVKGRRSIRDSLKDASALTADRQKQKTIAESVNKPLDQLTAKQRASLTEYLKKPLDGESDDQKEARKGFLKELRKLEPAKREKPETVREGMDGRNAALKKAIEAHRGSLDPKELHSPEQRQIRSEIKARWPGKKLPEVLLFFRDWHDRILREPLTAWRDLAAEYAANHVPINDAKAKKDDGKKDLSSSLKRASVDAGDIEELADAIKEYGGEFPELLRRANEWDKQLRADPFGAAARLAAQMGALTWQPSPQQQEEQRDRDLVASIAAQPATTAEGVAQQISQGIGLIMKHNVLPGLDDPAMQEEMAEVMAASDFPVHLGWGPKLKLAWQVVSDRRKHRKKKPDNGSDDAKAIARGSKSISGAPSAGGGAGSRGKSGIRGSLERAAGGV